jgi:hypothetical protein
MRFRQSSACSTAVATTSSSVHYTRILAHVQLTSMGVSLPNMVMRLSQIVSCSTVVGTTSSSVHYTRILAHVQLTSMGVSLPNMVMRLSHSGTGTGPCCLSAAAARRWHSSASAASRIRSHTLQDRHDSSAGATVRAQGCL